MAQALYNPNLAAVVGTREAFEAHLKSMSGLEYVVAEAPAETGPGMGTGVWVIRKQTRKKRGGNLEDEITVHADYFVIGENIYAAPSFADIMGSRLVGGDYVYSLCSKLIMLSYAGYHHTLHCQAIRICKQHPKVDTRAWSHFCDTFNTTRFHSRAQRSYSSTRWNRC